MATTKTNGKWFWRCDRCSVNVGCWNADYEECGARSKRGFKTELACRKAATKHDAKCWMNKPWDNRLGGSMCVWQETKKRTKKVKRIKLR